MGNGAMPNGPSYRAHPRLYPSGPSDLDHKGHFAKLERTKCASIPAQYSGADVQETRSDRLGGDLERHHLCSTARATASALTIISAPNYRPEPGNIAPLGLGT
jgi:hypothetical protein